LRNAEDGLRGAGKVSGDQRILSLKEYLHADPDLGNNGLSPLNPNSQLTSVVNKEEAKKTEEEEPGSPSIVEQKRDERVGEANAVHGTNHVERDNKETQSNIKQLEQKSPEVKDMEVDPPMHVMDKSIRCPYNSVILNSPRCWKEKKRRKRKSLVKKEGELIKKFLEQ
jgi:hypothetical protein